MMGLKNKSVKMLNDEFIKDFIIADIDDFAFNLLIPKMKLKEFNLDISTISKPKLEAMLNCNYFEFTVSRFDEIKNISDDLAIEFIIKNQTEYIDSIEDIEISNMLFETLLFNVDFTQDNKEELFKKYASFYMNRNIALNMKKFKKYITNEIFDSAWNVLNQEESIKLLVEYIECLNNDEIKQYLYQLNSPYDELSDRAEEHEVVLLNTEDNKLLADGLLKKSYISNYEEKKCVYDYDNDENEKDCLVLKVNET